ncbi:MAG: hypothetical protein ACI835_000714 [Planctomycetota bacterium]|jgi:hypothetical protein
MTCALVLCTGVESEGFVLTGDVLDLTQRDFRILNNFTDPTANDNQIPDPDFPGALGADLAIWKGVVEWGSQLHGTGLSDPLQPDGIGSGQSDFDASFQGASPVVGMPNQNIISQLDGFGGGILAFTETPSNNGWRIRFFENPTEWHDGPGLNSGGPNTFDIQGVMAHEYGHALGLGHTNVIGATMAGGVSSSSQMGIILRSIEADDIAGVQAIYGLPSPTKPRIDTYELTATGIALLGENFDPLDNEIWFTRVTAGGDGTPVKVIGLASSNLGTRLEVDIPADAGSGDVLVKLPGSNHSDLSNAFPIRPGMLPCERPVSYGVGKVNSQGFVAEMAFAGIASASTGSFQLSIRNASIFGAGVVFSGNVQASIPYAGGTLYAGPPFTRVANFSLQFGEAFVDIPIDPSMIGITRYYQMWYSDPADAFGFGLTNGIAITFCE